jgi:hypothetical protein
VCGESCPKEVYGKSLLNILCKLELTSNLKHKLNYNTKMKKFNHKKRNEVEGKEQYQVEISSSKLWNTCIMTWILIEPGKLLESI